MKRNEAITQFVRMVASGAISTAIAILSARRFEHWWAGLVGVPVALLLCDVQKSWGAIMYGVGALKNASWEGITSSINLSRPRMPKVFPPWAGKTVLGLTIGLSILLPIFVLSSLLTTAVWLYAGTRLGGYGDLAWNCYTIFVAAVIGMVLLNASKYLEQKLSDMRDFPLNHLLRNARFFRSWDASSDDSPFPYECVLRDDGLLWSARGVGSGLQFALELAGAVALLPLSAILLVPLFVIDLVITVLLKVCVAKSVSSALGVIVGFSADYVFLPDGASAGAALASLVLCSLLGGVSGWVFWQLKLKLADMELPSARFAAAE